MARSYTSVIIVAAGNSTRMAGEDKIVALISGKPLISYTIEAFEKAETSDEIIIVTRKNLIEKISDIVKTYKYQKVTNIICGGANRAQSVLSGFKEISPLSEYISIHDGARPFIKSEEIDLIHNKAYIEKAVCCSVKIKDTIKTIDSNGNIISTLDRNLLAAAATPQVFERKIYEMALKKAEDKLSYYTDDAGIVEDFGQTVKAVFCGYQNIKITTEEDLSYARFILSSNE